MGQEKLPVKFILCTEEDIGKMNSKKEQLENSIEEQKENPAEKVLEEAEEK